MELCADRSMAARLDPKYRLGVGSGDSVGSKP